MSTDEHAKSSFMTGGFVLFRLYRIIEEGVHAFSLS